MTPLNKIILFIILSTSWPVSANQDITFSQLNIALKDYSKKIEECDLSKIQIEIDLVKDKSAIEVILSTPSVLSYLNEKARNECLQPQKGLLAEAILYTKAESESSPAYKLGLNTQKMVFKVPFDVENSFNELNDSQRNTLLSIKHINLPFDALHLYESALSSSDSNKAM
ncbi:hypothetical protein [Psychromonas sp. Urea-02u-13]|uniref:hypothetical protein n=1 Tax=Psychromonas sp. Urea-02u-13 TaxID=2058326 RepID=UPI000C345CE1|nr:hypothetical protein [Psychromonas sp. Urea-02u-13]PKG39798.1 hypothetical protein CXF74_06480 [Psychromonas sp. Urea-02u-13]